MCSSADRKNVLAQRELVLALLQVDVAHVAARQGDGGVVFGMDDVAEGGATNILHDSSAFICEFRVSVLFLPSRPC